MIKRLFDIAIATVLLVLDLRYRGRLICLTPSGKRFSPSGQVLPGWGFSATWKNSMKPTSGTHTVRFVLRAEPLIITGYSLDVENSILMGENGAFERQDAQQ
jgi:hypothetical protein